MAEFLASRQGSRPVDYFVDLGMSCMPFTIAMKDAATRCEIELPIRITCTALMSFFPWGLPVPRELRRPISAFLRMSVDLSADTLLNVSTRIDPIPGGHLCHR
jgi:hypothetical protein